MRILLLMLLIFSPALGADELFPRAKDHQQGYLRVSPLHEIFYVCCGNPKGKPVMCIHGGPGAGCYPRMTQYFNPEKYNIVLHDQRGCANSKPLGELKENTTQNLIEDIEKLRKHLKLGKVLIFGGSWGTTLGLAYAEKYPDNVSGLILRGVFLGTEEEIEYHYMGNRFFFPKEYHTLLSVLPDPDKKPHPDYLYQLINGKDRELAIKVMDALARYELKFMKLAMPDATIDGWLKGYPKGDGTDMVNLDLHYVTNRYFLEKGQILRDLHKIKELPAVIINGRYDMASPPLSAYRVHKALPNSKLIMVEKAGHSESEEGITKELVKAAKSFE